MPKAKVANSEDPRFNRLRRELGRLCTNGVEHYWVLDVANHLLELDTVKARMKGTDDDSIYNAVVDELRDAVEKLAPRRHRRILTIVFGLDERYLGDSAKSRRTMAGMEFRDGSRPVSPETIRQHHEPKALDKLTELLLKRNPIS